MSLPILGIVTEALGLGRDWLAANRARKQAKLESELKLNEAKTDAMIDRMKTQQEADIAWENLSVQNSGWKDEWFTILLSIPMILCFLPGGAQYVKEGFQALNESTPEWYQWAFLIAIGSAFGVKKFTELMQLRKGA